MNLSMQSASSTKLEAQVASCYHFLDIIWSHTGLGDYTEGIYAFGDPSYKHAQERQHCYLLDQLGCCAGSRIFEIGCGAGTLLEMVRARGACGIGLTLSPEQARRCQSKDLNVRVMNYLDALSTWRHAFHGIVANGSLEHFVPVEAQLAGRSDQVYREFFEICRELLDPNGPRRVVTTAIHVAPDRHPDPHDVAQSPFAFRVGSERFHWSMIEKVFGGYYPALGQLERCAAPHFSLVNEVDGTEDYRRTSEEWLRRAVRAMFLSPGAFAHWRELFPYIARWPKHAILSLFGYLVTQSWHWQFRGANPPTRLRRQTWELV